MVTHRFAEQPLPEWRHAVLKEPVLGYLYGESVVYRDDMVTR